MYRFPVIYADPPWSFETYSDKGKGKSPDNHYPVLDISELCRLPVADVASPNAVLFLWVTWPGLFKWAPALLEAWGFEYRTMGFMWAKYNKRGVIPGIESALTRWYSERESQEDFIKYIESGLWFMGTGYYTRANTEPCLLAVRKGAKAPVANRGVRELIISPIGRHSAKPQEAYNRIEALYPKGPYLELFARTMRPGWVPLGNEVNQGMDIRESLPRLAAGLDVPMAEVLGAGPSAL